MTLYLPRLEDQPKPGAERLVSQEATPEGRGEVILVVEDEKEVRKLAIKFLAHLGYQAVAAEDGAAALAVLANTPDVAILFTDVILPGGLSGFELSRKACQQFPDLKVLYTSGYADTAFEQNVESVESEEILRKPYSRATLAQKLRATLNRGDA